MNKKQLRSSRKRMAERKMQWGLRSKQGRRFSDGVGIMPGDRSLITNVSGGSGLSMLTTVLAGMLARQNRRNSSRSS